jgi:hypothetical protein
MNYLKKYLNFVANYMWKIGIFAKTPKNKTMDKKIKELASAFDVLFEGGNYVLRAASKKTNTESIGVYQGALKDRENLSNDRRHIYSDINIAIREGYGKFAAQ